MKIIEGFSAVKAVLSRQDLAEFYQNDLEPAVRQIISEVRCNGDAALRDYTLRFDGIELTSLEVSKEQIASAYQGIDSELLTALKLAAERIRSFHLAQKRRIWRQVEKTGSVQLMRPLECVGVYVPGGTASYPSTVLMTAIPARVAGVKEIILVTPPRGQGSIPALTLVAADIAKVDRIFCVGGAQAIAALAFGTESVPRVDKICGPGNIFVVLAKKLVYGVVDIDGLQGPSEVLIIADETASPEYCAADLLAQAEHDPLASAILITTSRRLAEEVQRELQRQLEGLSRQATIKESLENRGVIVVVDDVEEAIELANLYAPEHLYLTVKDATACIDKIANAGCVVVGKNSTVVLGDYVAGPSHVLPTGGSARFGSPLNIIDFIKITSLVNMDKAGLRELGPAAITIASAEGFDAHARAVDRRLKGLS
ncbi:histidinol dehydrogenase [Chloroflexota bacterium]